MSEIDFGSLRILEPVSRQWGFDRGKPIDRYYIELFLDANVNAICGAVLEIKNSIYTSEYGGKRVTKSEVLDIDPSNNSATIIGDVTNPESFKSEQYDCVIFTQTLQFLDRPDAAIETLYKILKPGGRLLLTCPGITRIEHDNGDGGWYWSFTPLSLRMLLSSKFSCSNLQISTHGNVFAATCFLWGVSAGEVTSAELDHCDADYPVILTAHATKEC